MAIDYEALADVALDLVDEAGRDMTFVQYSQTPAVVGQPWLGPTDPRASVVQSHALPAVAVDVGTAKKLGIARLNEDLLKRATEFLIVAPGHPFSGDLSACHEVIDGSLRYSVVHVDVLKPGSTVLLYYIAVAR